MKTDVLNEIVEIQGVQGVLLCDDFGGVLQSAGRVVTSGTEASVLAQAAHSASDALGFRMGLGPCDEILQRHPHGGVRIRRVEEHRFLLIWHELELVESALEQALTGWKAPSEESGADSRAVHANMGGSLSSQPSLAEWDPFGPTPSP